MKLGQLIEYNKRVELCFFQKSRRKCSRETSARPLLFLEELYIREEKGLSCWFLILLTDQI